MLKYDDNYIPVDDAMQRFEDHLLSHDRVVLSAKFGDGKTFFLNKFKEKCKMDEESPFVSQNPERKYLRSSPTRTGNEVWLRVFQYLSEAYRRR